jgi:prevent-host-death family protein
MQLINIHKAKSNLSKLLLSVEVDHKVIVVCRHGKPIARIVPIEESPDHLKMHSELQGLKLDYNPTELLSSVEWPEEYK